MVSLTRRVTPRCCFEAMIPLYSNLPTSTGRGHTRIRVGYYCPFCNSVEIPIETRMKMKKGKKDPYSPIYEPGKRTERGLRL